MEVYAIKIEDATKEDLVQLYNIELKTMSEICKIYNTYHVRLSKKFEEFGIEPFKGCRKTSHGMQGTRIYNSWYNMKTVCKYPSANGYDAIGGKGISYDKKWENFVGFYEDMGDTYEDGLFLTRKDKEGDYDVDNCYWGTMEDIRYNTSSNIDVVVNDVKYTVREASEEYNIKEKTIHARYDKGWRGDELIEPVKEHYVTNIPHMEAFYRNGGVFQANEYTGFCESKKEQIRERDKYKCMECGLSNSLSMKDYGHSLHVHHIDYDKSNSSNDNLISLCPRCHGRTNIYGREHWEKKYAKIVSKLY